MLILEKTATTSVQHTPYLEYESLIIENLSDTTVNVLANFLDLRGQMVTDGAVVDKLEAYGVLEYSNVVTRKKRFWGLMEDVVHEIGIIQFWTDSGTANLRFKAFNGMAVKQRQWTSLQQKTLAGEDDTAVSTTSTSYVLKKTITLYNVDDLFAVFLDYKCTAASPTSLFKITSSVDGGSEVIEYIIVTEDGYLHYVEKALDLSGGVVVLKLYLKIANAGVTASSNVFKLYNYVPQVVSYA